MLDIRFDRTTLHLRILSIYLDLDLACSHLNLQCCICLHAKKWGGGVSVERGGKMRGEREGEEIGMKP